MYNIDGTFINDTLRGVNLISNKINIPNTQPSKTNTLESLQLAGAIHKEVRRKIQPLIKPNMKLLDLTQYIEKETIELCKKYDNLTINKGIGFPAGLSLNNCAAHWAPSSNSNITFNYDDVLKIDYGVEINGWIIDSAFTVTFNPKYDILLEAVKDATYTGMKNVGIDVLIPEWAESIREVMESYEINLNDNMCSIKVIETLGGHNIKNGIIHGGIFLPGKDLGNRIPRNNRFQPGVYAIETFGSTGINVTHEQGKATLFRLNPTFNPNVLKMDTVKKFYQKVKNNFSTLPFCDRYIELIDSKYNTYMDILNKNNAIYSYPPLLVYDTDYTAQYEHTIYLDETIKEICSQGEDY